MDLGIYLGKIWNSTNHVKEGSTQIRTLFRGKKGSHVLMSAARRRVINGHP